MEVPLAHLKEGENELTSLAGDQEKACGGFGWGQWGWYGAVLRIYYDSARQHTTGRIVSPQAGATFGEHPEIRIDTAGSADRVDVLAKYDGYSEDGDGAFEDWHGWVRYIDLRDHVGSSVARRTRFAGTPRGCLIRPAGRCNWWPASETPTGSGLSRLQSPI